VAAHSDVDCLSVPMVPNLAARFHAAACFFVCSSRAARRTGVTCRLRTSPAAHSCGHTPLQAGSAMLPDRILTQHGGGLDAASRVRRSVDGNERRPHSMARAARMLAEGDATGSEHASQRLQTWHSLSSGKPHRPNDRCNLASHARPQAHAIAVKRRERHRAQHCSGHRTQ